MRWEPGKGIREIETTDVSVIFELFRDKNKEEK